MKSLDDSNGSKMALHEVKLCLLGVSCGLRGLGVWLALLELQKAWKSVYGCVSLPRKAESERLAS